MRIAIIAKTKDTSNTARSMRGALIGGLLLLIGAGVLAGPALAQSGGPLTEREAVRMTVDTVFEGWRRLDLNLYMSVWDAAAVQYLKTGTTRTYNQIFADRANSFPSYSAVDASWTSESIEIYGDRATVVVRYSMTFYKKDGRVLRENEKEFYVLKRRPDAAWRIVENYDYLPR
ncbi:MAG: nuclear transport factor 2 family protein [Deltaproteobacteria bacterium]|nr:nuclear transport factor 2 family protein [Candidatus Zymogenaceae bacterium]